MNEIKKSKMPRLSFGPATEEWKTLSSEQQGAIVKALSNPVSWRIYEELGEGYIRQSELARRVAKSLGKTVTNALARYHLNRLEKAGLVEFTKGAGGGRAKMVSRAIDIRIQMRASGEGASDDEAPIPVTQAELTAGIKKIFRPEPQPWKKKQSSEE